MDIQKLMMQEKERYMKKWAPFLEGISDNYVAGNTALLLESEAQYLTEDAAKTSASDVVGLQKIMLPIVRRVFPNLISNNIVSVQPLAAPAGIIFYLKYVFGTANRPNTSQGDEFSMYEDTAGAIQGYNPWYSTDEIGPFTKLSTEDLVHGGTVVTDAIAAGTTTAWPVTAGSHFGIIEQLDADSVPTVVYSFAKESGSFVVRQADRLATSTAYTVTEAGNQVTVTNNTSATQKWVRVKMWYKTDMEFSTAIPEMKITIANIPVAVKTRKLKAMWSQESEQDLKAYHGLSADAELTALVSNEMISEIDREVIQKCMSIVPASSRFIYDWNSFATNNTTGNYLDAHLALMQKVTRASNEVFRKSKVGPANWMIVGTKVASYVEVLKGFIPNPVTASMGMSIVKAGTYSGRFDVYKDPMFPDDKILMGHKSPASPFGAGVVYSPYVTNLTPVIVGQDDFNPRRGFLARYGLTQVPHGQLLYTMLDIKDLP